MRGDGSCILPLAGVDRHFKLTIGDWMKLQAIFNAGPAVIVERLLSSTEWKIEDLIEVTQIALEGGGLDPVQAQQVARDGINDEPLVVSLLTVQAILQAAYVGMDEPRSKKAQAPDQTPSESMTSPTGNGGSEPFSAAAT